MIPRRNLVAAGLLLLLGVGLSIGRHDYTGLLGGVVLFASLAFFFWLRVRRGGKDR